MLKFMLKTLKPTNRISHIVLVYIYTAYTIGILNQISGK